MKNKFTLSIFTEDRIGLLNRITIIFTRRHINIQSITASESEVKGVFRYTIVVTEEEDLVKKLIGQIEKQVEVLKAFYHVENEIIGRELAIYKLSSKALTQGEEFTKLLNKHHARIVSVHADYLTVEKTGDDAEIKNLFQELAPYEVLEFACSGRVAVTKPMKTLSTYLKEIESKYNLNYN